MLPIIAILYSDSTHFWPLYVPFLAYVSFRWATRLREQFKHGPQERLIAKFRPGDVEIDNIYSYSRCPGLPASSLPVCPVYRCFFFVPPRHPGVPVVCRYTGVVHFFMLAEPLLLLHTPTHAAAHNTTQHAGCCGQQPILAYTPCHVRQENYANLATALPPQNSPPAAHAEVACTAFEVILMTTRKSTASANHALQQRSLPAVPMTTRMRPSVKREGVFYNKAHRKNEKARPASGSLWGKSERFFSFWIRSSKAV